MIRLKLTIAVNFRMSASVGPAAAAGAAALLWNIFYDLLFIAQIWKKKESPIPPNIMDI